MLRLGSLVVVLVACASAHVLMPSVGFTDCNSRATIHSISLVPCTAPSTDGCTIEAGHTYDVNITFTSSVDVNIVDKIYHAVVAGFSVLLPLGGSAPCDHDLTCPVTNGLQTSYATQAMAPAFVPAMHVVIKAELVDRADGTAFVCAEIPIVVVNS